MKSDIIEAATGKFVEPKHTGLVHSKMDMVRALNHYNVFASPENLKAWSMTYLHKHHPDLVTHVSKAPMSVFGTFGALCRMSERGFDFADKVTERIHRHFADVAGMVKIANAVPLDVEIKVAPKAKPSRSREAFEMAIDDILIEQTLVAVNLVASESHKDIVEQCQKGLLEISEYPEAFAGKSAALLKKFYQNTLDKISKMKATSKAAVKVPNKSNPAKMVKDVRFLRKVEFNLDGGGTIGLKSLDPIDTLERKKMYVFDAKYRRLIVFVAMSSAGFVYAGTTLKNVDLSKSFSKTLRKPEEFFKNTRIGVAELNKAFADVKAKETPMVSARFNPDWLILKVTEKGA